MKTEKEIKEIMVNNHNNCKRFNSSIKRKR